MPSLLQIIDRHLRLTGMSPTRLGRESIGDPRFYFDLKNGREPRPVTAARIIAFIETRT